MIMNIISCCHLLLLLLSIIATLNINLSTQSTNHPPTTTPSNNNNNSAKLRKEEGEQQQRSSVGAEEINISAPRSPLSPPLAPTIEVTRSEIERQRQQQPVEHKKQTLTSRSRSKLAVNASVAAAAAAAVISGKKRQQDKSITPPSIETISSTLSGGGGGRIDQGSVVVSAVLLSSSLKKEYAVDVSKVKIDLNLDTSSSIKGERHKSIEIKHDGSSSLLQHQPTTIPTKQQQKDLSKLDDGDGGGQQSMRQKWPSYTLESSKSGGGGGGQHLEQVKRVRRKVTKEVEVYSSWQKKNNNSYNNNNNNTEQSNNSSRSVENHEKTTQLKESQPKTTSSGLSLLQIEEGGAKEKRVAKIDHHLSSTQEAPRQAPSSPQEPHPLARGLEDAIIHLTPKKLLPLNEGQQQQERGTQNNSSNSFLSFRSEQQQQQQAKIKTMSLKDSTQQQTRVIDTDHDLLGHLAESHNQNYKQQLQMTMTTTTTTTTTEKTIRLAKAVAKAEANGHSSIATMPTTLYRRTRSKLFANVNMINEVNRINFIQQPLPVAKAMAIPKISSSTKLYTKMEEKSEPNKNKKRQVSHDLYQQDAPTAANKTSTTSNTETTSTMSFISPSSTTPTYSQHDFIDNMNNNSSNIIIPPPLPLPATTAAATVTKPINTFATTQFRLNVLCNSKCNCVIIDNQPTRTNNNNISSEIKKPNEQLNETSSIVESTNALVVDGDKLNDVVSFYEDYSFDDDSNVDMNNHDATSNVTAATLSDSDDQLPGSGSEDSGRDAANPYSTNQTTLEDMMLSSHHSHNLAEMAEISASPLEAVLTLAPNRYHHYHNHLLHGHQQQQQPLQTYNANLTRQQIFTNSDHLPPALSNSISTSLSAINSSQQLSNTTTTTTVTSSHNVTEQINNSTAANNTASLISITNKAHSSHIHPYATHRHRYMKNYGKLPLFEHTMMPTITDNLIFSEASSVLNGAGGFQLASDQRLVALRTLNMSGTLDLRIINSQQHQHYRQNNETVLIELENQLKQQDIQSLVLANNRLDYMDWLKLEHTIMSHMRATLIHLDLSKNSIEKLGNTFTANMLANSPAINHNSKLFMGINRNMHQHNNYTLGGDTNNIIINSNNSSLVDLSNDNNANITKLLSPAQGTLVSAGPSPAVMVGEHLVTHGEKHQKTTSLLGNNINQNSIVLNLRALDLSYNRLRILINDQFKVLKHAQTIRLDHNKLKYIHQHAFNGLESLRFLNLNHNNIKVVFIQQFQTNFNLLALMLRANDISYLLGGTFSSLVNLKRLDLSRNSLGLIKNNAFAGMDSLEWLDLSKNRFVHVPSSALHPLKRLRDLDLSYNRFVRLAPGTFFHLTIERLWLNNLDDLILIDSGAFWDLPYLRELCLNNNPQLMQINNQAFVGTHFLHSINYDNTTSLPESDKHLLDNMTMANTVRMLKFEQLQQQLNINVNNNKEQMSSENATSQNTKLSLNNNGHHRARNYQKLSPAFQMALSSVGTQSGHHDMINNSNYPTSLLNLSKKGRLDLYSQGLHHHKQPTITGPNVDQLPEPITSELHRNHNNLLSSVDMGKQRDTSIESSAINFNAILSCIIISTFVLIIIKLLYTFTSEKYYAQARRRRRVYQASPIVTTTTSRSNDLTERDSIDEDFSLDNTRSRSYDGDHYDTDTPMTSLNINVYSLQNNSMLPTISSTVDINTIQQNASYQQRRKHYLPFSSNSTSSKLSSELSMSIPSFTSTISGDCPDIVHEASTEFQKIASDAGDLVNNTSSNHNCIIDNTFTPQNDYNDNSPHQFYQRKLFRRHSIDCLFKKNEQSDQNRFDRQLRSFYSRTRSEPTSPMKTSQLLPLFDCQIQTYDCDMINNYPKTDDEQHQLSVGSNQETPSSSMMANYQIVTLPCNEENHFPCDDKQQELTLCDCYRSKTCYSRNRDNTNNMELGPPDPGYFATDLNTNHQQQYNHNGPITYDLHRQLIAAGYDYGHANCTHFYSSIGPALHFADIASNFDSYDYY